LQTLSHDHTQPRLRPPQFYSPPHPAPHPAVPYHDDQPAHRTYSESDSAAISAPRSPLRSHEIDRVGGILLSGRFLHTRAGVFADGVQFLAACSSLAGTALAGLAAGDELEDGAEGGEVGGYYYEAGFDAWGVLVIGCIHDFEGEKGMAYEVHTSKSTVESESR